jgi:transaldolase
MDTGGDQAGDGEHVNTPDLATLKTKIFADGADAAGISSLAQNPLIRGFTTNPTLMRAAGVEDYEQFAREILEVVPDHPVSFEVLSDDFDEMERQALKIAAWGPNVYVKIPISNCRGQSSVDLLRRLADNDLHLNVTAIMTVAQVEMALKGLQDAPHGYISVFAGRIADTGRFPVPIMRSALDAMAGNPHLELIWASPREVLNLFEADAAGCHVITMTHDLLKKLPLIGKDIDQFSLDTVKMFFNDAEAARFSL